MVDVGRRWTREIRERAFAFAVRAIRLADELSKAPGAPRIVSHQFVRSATSIGANLEEAQGSHSRRDFAFRIGVAAREAREAKYWLRLIVAAEMIPAARLSDLIQESEELVAVLTTIARQARSAE